jgi:undecaprenyl-diphosphatase
MHFAQILILAVLQGLAELLPVSSSAHVIVAEKLMGLDPTTPEMTLFLLMLHTGTMFSVLIYFWKDWRATYLQFNPAGWSFIRPVLVATAATGVVGLGLKLLIEKIILRATPNAEVELLFGHLRLISGALAMAGLLILFASTRERFIDPEKKLAGPEALLIGIVQGLCLPFRGFSRSGATISSGLLLRLPRPRSEEFSFALAVVLTAPLLAKEAHRLVKAHAFSGLTLGKTLALFAPGLLGLVFSFAAGLLALRWLSNWLVRGRWKWFGIYCLAFSAVVLALSFRQSR